MATHGKFRYAPKVFVDYLTPRHPGILICTEIPHQRVGPVVQIGSLPAGQPPRSSMVLRWSRMLVTCIDDRRTGYEETDGADLADEMRSEIVGSRFDHVIRDWAIVGEPSKVAFPNERVPVFQFTIDVLLREFYPERQAVTTT